MPLPFSPPCWLPGVGRSAAPAEATTVSEESFQSFHEVLEEADDVGRAALDLDPSNPGAACARLTSGRGLGLPADEWWHRFDVGRRARSTLFPAHHHMLQALCKKWYGSHEMMLDFARRVAREAPVGDPVGVMLAEAHAEYLIEEGTAPGVAGGPGSCSPLPPSSGSVGARLPCGIPGRSKRTSCSAGPSARVTPSCERSTCPWPPGRLASLPWNYLKDGEKAYRELLDKGSK